LYQSVKYIIKNNIEGDFAECGVWKGGSCMLIAYTLMNSGIDKKQIFLYDTFEGMVRPSELDGKEGMSRWEANKISETQNKWCYASFEEVKTNMEKTGYPFEKVKMIKGKVEETIPATIPERLSLLRLDTDWYESTRHELIHLYPVLLKHGVLIIDDYGAWQGARKAVDEYFNPVPYAFLFRVDPFRRIIIK
jgi:hypothetical protein